MNHDHFRELVWERGHELYRDMPWRDEPTFYHVLVSELMLQQTQVSRVLTKFDEFTRAFPSINELAAASLADVLGVWTGLGYNRRAKFLHEAAKEVVAHGEPTTLEELVKLPGVGKNTAGAIMNYVHEVPTAYVETNIRTVYFNYLFADTVTVSDAELLAVVEETMDRVHPREWFWALMDIGSDLKATGRGKLDVSRHYKRQAPLKGSIREIRGQLIRALTRGDMSLKVLQGSVDVDERFDAAVAGLMRDGLITKSGDDYHLTK